MKTTDAVGELMPALLKARRAFPAILKDASNPTFHSRYASLGAIVSAVTPALLENGLVLSQGCGRADEAGMEIVTRLTHKSGEHVETVFWLPLSGTRRKLTDDQGNTTGYDYDPITAQNAGSAFTYGRRYALSALLGIVADDDDDGEATRPASQVGRSSRGSSSGGASGSDDTGDAPTQCPKCGRGVYDNRKDKASGRFKPKYPDFKCRERECDWAHWGSWPPKDASAQASAPLGNGPGAPGDDAPPLDDEDLPF